MYFSFSYMKSEKVKCIFKCGTRAGVKQPVWEIVVNLNDRFGKLFSGTLLAQTLLTQSDIQTPCIDFMKHLILNTKS